MCSIAVRCPLSREVRQVARKHLKCLKEAKKVAKYKHAQQDHKGNLDQHVRDDEGSRSEQSDVYDMEATEMPDAIHLSKQLQWEYEEAMRHRGQFRSSHFEGQRVRCIQDKAHSKTRSTQSGDGGIEFLFITSQEKERIASQVPPFMTMIQQPTQI